IHVLVLESKELSLEFRNRIFTKLVERNVADGLAALLDQMGLGGGDMNLLARDGELKDALILASNAEENRRPLGAADFGHDLLQIPPLHRLAVDLQNHVFRSE